MKHEAIGSNPNTSVPRGLSLFFTSISSACPRLPPLAGGGVPELLTVQHPDHMRVGLHRLQGRQVVQQGNTARPQLHAGQALAGEQHAGLQLGRHDRSALSCSAGSPPSSCRRFWICLSRWTRLITAEGWKPKPGRRPLPFEREQSGNSLDSLSAC